MRGKKIGLAALLVLLTFVALIGPWPVTESDFRHGQYTRLTFERINQVQPETFTGPLQAGVGRADITPPSGTPLGGYSARSPKANEGVMTPVAATALSLGNGRQTITLISVDILLPLPQLVDAVVARTGLPREHLYFAASHTHSGPGGYSDDFIGEFSLGEFQPEYFHHLVTQIAQAISDSRRDLRPSRLRFFRLRPPAALSAELIYNQFDQPAHDTVPVLQVLPTTHASPRLTLVSFSAHPTFLGRANKKISGDYPALLQQRLERSLGGKVMFIAGAVGAMLPKGLGETPSTDLSRGLAQMDDMAQRLADFITESLARESATVELEAAAVASHLLLVNLPPPSYRISDHWRLSPWLIDLLFHNRRTYLHAVQIGPIVWLGYPADYSGELALELERWARWRGIYPWVTSFNGDYIGYLSPSKRYSQQHYTVREVNFYGRWTGDYFNELSKRLLERLSAAPWSQLPQL